MKKLQHTIVINATPLRVWESITKNKKEYEEWTAGFHAGSTYEGDWSVGSTMKFLGPNEDGTVGGMYAEIVDNRPGEYVSIRHLGMITNGVVDTESDEVKKWAPAYENYTFIEKDGGTEFTIDMDCADDWYDYMVAAYQKTLPVLKEICERMA